SQGRRQKPSPWFLADSAPVASARAPQSRWPGRDRRRNRGGGHLRPHPLEQRSRERLRRLSELGGKRIPFLRWSVVRMILGARHLLTNWQVGDGREEAPPPYVGPPPRADDLDDVIRVIDEFCYEQSIMMNVGDEKGEILDRAVRRVRPRRLLELGTYCGYSALRMARVMSSEARLYSIEFSEANARIARRIWDHAGIGDRATMVVGSLGDGGQ